MQKQIKRGRKKDDEKEERMEIIIRKGNIDEKINNSLITNAKAGMIENEYFHNA